MILTNKHVCVHGAGDRSSGQQAESAASQSRTDSRKFLELGVLADVGPFETIWLILRPKQAAASYNARRRYVIQS